MQTTKPKLRYDTSDTISALENEAETTDAFNNNVFKFERISIIEYIPLD